LISKKYFEQVGEQKAAAHPIGTGPFRHVEGKQGDYTVEANAGHWRKTPGFKELVIRKISEPATRLSGLRAGEIDVIQVFGDFLRAGAEVGLPHPRASDAAQYWVILTGQTTPDREDYCPPARGGRARQREEPREREEGAARDEPRRRQEGDHHRALEGRGAETPYSYYYYPSTRATARLEGARLRTLRARKSCWPRPGTPAASRCA